MRNDASLGDNELRQFEWLVIRKLFESEITANDAH